VTSYCKMTMNLKFHHCLDPAYFHLPQYALHKGQKSLTPLVEDWSVLALN